MSKELAGVLAVTAVMAAGFCSAGNLDLQACIDATADHGGGTVVVSAGEWETKPVILKSGVKLRLEKGAVLLASTNILDYAATSTGQRVFIYAEDSHDIAIEGEGVICGRGGGFREKQGLKGESQPQALPILMRFARCRNVRLEDFTFRDGAAWGCHLMNCDGVVVRRMKAFNHVNNTNDGIDVESRNVLIEDCDIDTDDDAIVFKTESDRTFAVENVEVRNCRLKSCCNAIKFGTGSYADWRNIDIHDCIVSRAEANFRFDWRKRTPGVTHRITGLAAIALEVVDGGRMEHIKVRNIEIRDGFQTPIFIRHERRNENTDGKGTYLRNVLIENVRGKAESLIASSITGVPGLRPCDITLRNIELEMPGGDTASAVGKPVPELEKAYPDNHMFGFAMLPAWGFYIRHADRVRFDNVKLVTRLPDARAKFVTDDCTAITIHEDPLEKFWDSLDGRNVHRLPVQVVPENAFISLSNVNFDRPVNDLENQLVDLLGTNSTYNVITLTLRSIPDLSDGITERRAGQFIDRAHAHGIQVLMDIDARIARREFLKRWPQHHAGVLRTGVFSPTNGVVEFSLNFGTYRDHMAWGAERGYEPIASELAEVYAIKVGEDAMGDPATRRELKGEVSKLSTISNLVSGVVAGLADDERLVVAAKFRLFAVDPCSPQLTPFLEELAYRYRRLGADGAMRDEWGFPPMRDYVANHSAYPCTALFAEHYANQSGGRDLVRDCMLLAQGERGAESVRSRAIDDIMRVIYRRIVATEHEFYLMNKRVFGPEVYVTKHPTWHTRFCGTEFMHDGFDWWGATRDWAQSDESVPLPCITGMAKKFGGPVWLNEGYGPNPEHYGFALWRYALAGGRMVYHGIYGGNSSVKGLPPEAAKIHVQQDILDYPGNVRAQSRVRLLNLVSRAQIDCPVAIVFGHARLMNWLDPAYEDGGLKLAYALGARGYYADAYPSSEIAAGTIALDGDGYLRVGRQRYDALVMHRWDKADSDAFAKLLEGRRFKTRLYAYDSPATAGAAMLIAPDDIDPVIVHLDDDRATLQAPLTKRGLTPYSNDPLPASDGLLTLQDGTIARIKGCMPNYGGDAIEGTLPLKGKAVSYRAQGVFAARFDAAGNLEALAGGGVTRVLAADFRLELGRGEDIALVKRAGQWQGIWQTDDATAQVPAALKEVTGNWTRLIIPKGH